MHAVVVRQNILEFFSYDLQLIIHQMCSNKVTYHILCYLNYQLFEFYQLAENR